MSTKLDLKVNAPEYFPCASLFPCLTLFEMLIYCVAVYENTFRCWHRWILTTCLWTCHARPCNSTSCWRSSRRNSSAKRLTWSRRSAMRISRTSGKNTAQSNWILMCCDCRLCSCLFSSKLHITPETESPELWVVLWLCGKAYGLLIFPS